MSEGGADGARSSDARAWSAADRHQRSIPHPDRKRRGAWFTPPELALPTAARAIAPLDDGRPLRVCDPAVGGGALLLAARAALARSSAAFVGVDVDPGAVEIARVAATRDGDTALRDKAAEVQRRIRASRRPPPIRYPHMSGIDRLGEWDAVRWLPE